MTALLKNRFKRLNIRFNLALTLLLMSAVIPLRSTAQRHGRPFSFPARHKAVVLSIEGKLATPLNLSSAEFRSLPRSSVNVVQTSGGSWTYEGVALIEILRRAGAPVGTAKRKLELVTYVEAVSLTGARAIFSLSEIDPAFLDSNVLVADTLNGSPIGVNVPKLCLIAGSDKVPGRSIENLVIVRVRRVR